MNNLLYNQHVKTPSGILGTVKGYGPSELVRINPALPPYTPEWVRGRDCEVVDREKFECLLAAYQELDLLEKQVEVEFLASA